jgi:hypothetical protein
MASSYAGALGLMDTTMSSAIRHPRSRRYYRLESILLVRLDWGSIQHPPRTSMCLNIWRRMVSAWVWTSTHLKLQQVSLRNLNGTRRLSWHFQNQQLCFLMVVCTILGFARVTIIYLLWIWRERQGRKFLTSHVFFSRSIHQAQGHLFQCTVGGHNMSKLSI